MKIGEIQSVTNIQKQKRLGVDLTSRDV